MYSTDITDSGLALHIGPTREKEVNTFAVSMNF